MKRKHVLTLLCALFLCVSLTGNALGADSTAGTCSITVSPYALDAGEALCAGSFTLYQVAEPGEDGTLTALGVFSDYDLSGTHSAELAAELAAAAERGGAEGTTKEVSSAGTAVFTGLEEGLYLVVQAECAAGYQEIPPFLISVSADDTDGAGSACAYPKAEPEEPTPDEPTPDEPTPDEPTPEEPTPVSPPYTGDDAAIVLYAALAACAAVVIVLVVAYKARKNKD